MNKTQIALVLGALIGTPSIVFSQATISYPFISGSPAPTVTGVDASSVSAANFLSFNGGDTSQIGFSSSSNNAFLRGGTTTGDTLESALDNSYYFQFTFSAANAGEVLDLDSFTLNFGATTGTVGFTTNLVIQSSVGGFGSGNPVLSLSNTDTGLNNGTVSIPANQSSPYYQNIVVDVSDSAFDSISSIAFQVRVYDNGTNNSVQINRFDNINIEATPVTVPEPAYYTSLLGLAVIGLVFLRRKKACRS
ncbi:PEP-CTERM sorting domain-containing protein [Cerasicoccus fimbriatus]|uniref:PEP-CTERM sorting domain-containing protein n=1 Tax=Cerasicoccus fimbriatus TaxID=3014554 RepID=UPI0022B55074|nr:PEP-CTERM sorting domain-containing protein [Cerasicoccus sp. TK19100]